MKDNSTVRIKILDTATKLFYSQGFQATGINQIIEEAGIAKASLYDHYPSKNDLLADYLRRSTERWMADFEAAQIKTAAGKPYIMALFEYRKNLALKNGFRGCAFIRILYELPDLSEENRAIIQSHKDRIKELIRNNVKALPRQATSKMINGLTDTITCLYEGSGVQSSLQQSVKPIEDAKKIVSGLLN